MKTVKEKIEALRRELEYYGRKYYDEDDPEISDYQYDQLSLELRKLEQDYPEYVSKDSPTEKVGGTVKRELKKVEHDVPVISLQDGFSREEVEAFVEKVREDLETPEDLAFVVEKKIDGLSVVLRYHEGKLTEAITRGDGVIGESVYENALEIQDLPITLPEALPYLEVRGEVYMTQENFERANEKQRETGGKLYQNRRNIAAGTLRQLDASIVRERGLNIFIFNLEVSRGKEFSRHSETLQWMKEQGFPITPDYALCRNAQEVWDAIEKIGEQRLELEYGIDGAVVKVDRLDLRRKMGMTSKVPRWAIAYKYEPEKQETVIEKIVAQVGRTGRITPLAILEPVRLAGTTVSRATLHNQDYIDGKDIRVGDTVVVQKAGDIIPEVLEVVKEKRPEHTTAYVLPDHCPICGAPAERETEGAHLHCTGESCYAKRLRSLIYFASKDAMNIEGFGPSTAEALMENGYVEEIPDLYHLKEFREELIQEGIIGKEKSVDNLLNAIERSRENDLDRLITGFGIRNVGKQTAKTLAQRYPDLDGVMGATPEELMELTDFGEIVTRDLTEFFQRPSTKAMVEKLREAGVNLKSLAQESQKDERFSGKTFVLTGTLPSMTRDEATAIIESFGGKASGSVSKKTSYVLLGDGAGSKLKKAQELGIPILSQADFEEMIR